MSQTLASKRSAHLRQLIASRVPGHGLPRPFYQEDAVYGTEIDAIWRRGWVFAGHSCQLREPGDYLTLTLDTDPLVVLRDDDGQLRAFHNVCRHRGMILCQEEAGHVGRIVCPYHQWVYGRDGALVSCRGMQEEIDTSELGLRPVHVAELAGLVYISLADEPLPFAPAAELMEPLMRPQRLERAKIAKTVDYEIEANWKLVWENNRECFHCNVNHPQYIKANYDHINADDVSPAVQEQMTVAVTRSEEKWAAAGLAVTHHDTGMCTFPDAERNLWYSANRTAMAEGFVSETLEGRQVAPLMGDYQDSDVGTLRLRTMPNFWNHSSCDHGVTTRLLPAGPRRTRAQVTWLVDESAVEGRDYRVDDLLPFWQLTSEQDWDLCASAQRGVDSRAFVPGPLSTYKEYNVEAFFLWYLRQLTDYCEDN
ncbi:MAG: aromatic ring-hydroxylating dioxygenase subunit alpha [Planctomycetota bacterium]|nr:MAG: aromatic ring-hydroxylating dioxygenase subunit alpha [Planctomycetota bacterium]REJ95050.1 MAG: aromatic ring-hydroxylating dioxygenase subunit alpha [Planctomycetota bacterium]REK25273.1 MAG: aromatic ring-hydroxylating dioxygenase subunit alpha [Planctomycetota bacterium]REK49500.1 MAG: aromatic ring-hydroxylating dioxygenase subunit alpha [Planctomycetota bacterium]